MPQTEVLPRFDLRFLPRDQFLSIGKPLSYAYRRTGTHRLKRPDGVTRVYLHLCLNGKEIHNPQLIVPDDGTLMFDESRSQWVHLEERVCETRFEVLDAENRDYFERGKESLFRYKPWRAVKLERACELIDCVGIIHPAHPDDIVVDPNYHPARYGYFTRFIEEAGTYERVPL